MATPPRPFYGRARVDITVISKLGRARRSGFSFIRICPKRARIENGRVDDQHSTVPPWRPGWMALDDEALLMTDPFLTTTMGAKHGVGCIVADLATHHQPAVATPVVLVMDYDPDIGTLLEDFLTAEGYAVRLLRSRRGESIQDAVERHRPDCVLLDGYVPGSYGGSWANAAWMAARPVPVPVIMLSADQGATAEARLNLSERSQAAGFSGVIAKPFELDELLRVVEAAVSRPPFRIDN